MKREKERKHKENEEPTEIKSKILRAKCMRQQMKTILVGNMPRYTKKNARIEAHRSRQNLARMNFNLIINKTRWKQVVIGGWKSEMAKTRTKLNKDTLHIRIMKSARHAVTGTATDIPRACIWRNYV